MAKNKKYAPLQIVFGVIFLLMCGNEILDLIEGYTMSEGQVATGILYGLIGIFLLSRGIINSRNDKPKSP